MTTRTVKPQLRVTIESHGSGLGAVSADGLRCILVNADEMNPKVGDVWMAEAHSGRVTKKDPTKIRLLVRVGQGFLTTVPGHWIDRVNLEMLQAFLHAGLHVAITGPPGSGKTTLGARLATALSWGHHLEECSFVLTPGQLFGSDAALSGSSRFIPSAMTQWLERVASDSSIVTHLLVLDEINRMQGRAANGLLGLLGPYRQTLIPTIDGTRTIKLPRNVGVIATLNEGREYTGTHALDRALADRLQPVNVGRAPIEAMVALLKPKYGGIQEVDIIAIVTAAQVMADQFESRVTIRTAPSYRGVEAALTLRQRGWPVNACVESGFMIKMNDQERSDMWGAITVRLPSVAAPAKVSDAHAAKA